MQPLDQYDLPKETAEKVLKAIMKPVREVMDGTGTIDKELATSMDQWLGVIAMGLTHQYSNEKQYQDAVATVSRENVRLNDAVGVLAEQNTELQKTIKELTEQITAMVNPEPFDLTPGAVNML